MELRDLGGALWRQRLLVLLVLVITALAGIVGLRLAPKTYTARAAVSAAADSSVATGSDSPDTLRSALGALANSRGVISDVRSQLSVSRDADDLRREITGVWVADTILIEITVTDRDPVVAADIANIVARVLPTHDSSNAFVFTLTDRAEPPSTFTSPSPLLALGVGTALAVLLAVAGALARDRRTHTVDDGATVEASTSAPLLAHVALPRDPTALPALFPGTAAADVFRHLRTALEAEASKSPVSRVVVAGVTSGDANVWLGANIAISLADVGRRVLLVDGRMGERFGRPGPQEPDTPGLYDVLTGTPLDDAISPGPAPQLSVLPSGAWGVEPPEALIESRFSAVIARAQTRFDVVVVLAPPLDVCDDARVMAAGGSLVLAVPVGGVTPDALRAHADRVRAVGARLLGVVLVSRRSDRAPA